MKFALKCLLILLLSFEAFAKLTLSFQKDIPPTATRFGALLAISGCDAQTRTRIKDQKLPFKLYPGMRLNQKQLVEALKNQLGYQELVLRWLGKREALIPHRPNTAPLNPNAELLTMVEKGALVSARFQQGAILLKVSAIALESGGQNETILVENTSSHQRFKATILASKQVEAIR